ncbi:ROK family transcriptional regulator [Pseudonocardia acidicola]|uniref:ROK family transcriptional regulator n=1 Tax=Pseudonocardia acidicola TaxID=2724939 RepID=A0ABX1S8F0_9PSEU|nr:ROK family transcriptional regulator [Pseudonocardia acidicola]NMH96544.1 ROK family transcriptional regulator [Pseudonocardia acidicola]
MSDVRTADRGYIREVNLRAVVETLRRLGAMTRAGIARETGLSGPTVSAVVTTLTEAGVVTPVGEGPATGGRRGDLYELNAGSRTVLAVDLSGEPARHALVDLNGGIVAGSLHAVPATALRSPATFVRWLAKQASRLEHVIGIGLAVPGVTDPLTGTIEWAPSLGWRDVRLLDEVRATVPTEVVVVDNDLNLAALGEHAFGEHDSSDLVMFGVRGGLGAGLILGGALHRGVHFAAGEIGYLPAPSGVRGSRDFGPLETTLFDHMRAIGEGAAADLASAAEMAGIAEILTSACLAVAAVLDVGVIVLGEEILRYGRRLDEELTGRLADVLPHPPTVIPSRLGADATLRGAAAAVHQQVNTDVRRLLI